MTATPIVLGLDAAGLSIEEVGGKGRTLALLTTAGLPVPDGFVITTRAYAEFVQAGGLTPAADALEIDTRVRFDTAPMPRDLGTAIAEAYAAFADRPVAVRSSATAEDLPDLSFAGAQDTFLNVRGESALMIAVRRCWASLWSARAIAYRTRMNVDHHSAAMAVVVQSMVEAEVSGVLFTANPATGDRSELVVNASFGLGEAVVGGHVTPDTLVLDRHDQAIKTASIGTKTEMVVSAPDQGTRVVAVPEARRGARALPDDRLREVAELGLQAELCLGGPQDVEWAVTGRQCWLLQSRPITRLQEPAPAAVWEPPHQGSRLVRRQVVENMPEPLSPLFESLYLAEGLDLGMDHMVTELGLPFDFGDFIDRPLFVTVNGYGYCRYDFRISWRTFAIVPRALYWYVTTMPKWLKQLVDRWRDNGLAPYLATIERWKRFEPDATHDLELLSGIRELAIADATYWYYITTMVGAAKVTEGLLDRFLSSRLVKGELTAAMFLRGLPSKPLEAQRDLAVIAGEIAGNPALRDVVVTCPTGRLIETLAASSEASIAFQALSGHLETYGHQVYNLDFAAPTQGEDPTPVLLSLRALVGDPQALASWDARQAAMVGEREALERTTRASLDPIRRWLFDKLLRGARKYAPGREEALFYMGAAWPTLRRLALELGGRLADAGTLAAADDVFYLTSDELAAACRASARGVARLDLQEQAQALRKLREARKRLHPPGRVPEDLRFKFGPFDFTRFFETWETQKMNAGDAAILHGFAVSSGKVTATASVILSPADFAAMRPQTILVCPATTPAWTPLFGQAVGLVTDIGAVLAHGSIVAREYGIPAVLGTGNATRRIESGQRISVDGDSGTVTLID